MDFKSIQTSALFRCDEEIDEVITDDPMIYGTVKDAINEAHRIVAQRVDKITGSQSDTYATIIALPTNVFEVYKVFNGNKELDKLDYEIDGRELRITNKDYQNGTINTYFYKNPERLIDDTTTPEVAEAYHDMMAVYGAYRVMLYKKKYDSAAMLFKEFTNMIGGEDGEL